VAHGTPGRDYDGLIPDDLPFDLARIGEVLEYYAVRYVLIGGVSGTFYGMVDYRTRDVDLLVQGQRWKPRPPRGCVDGARGSASPNGGPTADHGRGSCYW
jgi:hypothetical protein